MSSKVSLDEVNTFFATAFEGERTRPTIVALEDGMARVHLPFNSDLLRPGNVISGPTQMSLADTATYAAIFTRIGITPMTVTSSLNMSFLRPCPAEDVIATANLLKLGRKLAVAEVDIRGASQEKPASHAVVTYAIPEGTTL